MNSIRPNTIERPLIGTLHIYEHIFRVYNKAVVDEVLSIVY